MVTVKKFDGKEGNVWKFVFDFGDAIAEAVLYKYQSFGERTVLCISVQSGCPVGCKFCGTGKKFVRNLTSEEIQYQVTRVLLEMNLTDCIKNCRKFQIMFMSMGEPFLNYFEVEKAIISLNMWHPNAQLLVSTMGPKKPQFFGDFIKLSHKINKVGLQFSVHEAIEEKRNLLIPFKDKLTLREMRDIGICWHGITDRKVYINYCVNENNVSQVEKDRLMDLFSPYSFAFTFSVICSADETMKDAGFRNKVFIEKFMQSFVDAEYDCRMFDPAGQDDIGGGCGQLWYVQEWMKKHGR
jgi:23S rRNA (adenine2503-C2)-methyltransferase